MKLMKSVAATAASLFVAITGTAMVQPGVNTANEAYCEKVGATADEVFDYAASFEGWKLYDFRANGWNTNDSYWCAWYASTMLMDCNVSFPVPDFNLRIWVADILAGYIDEERYVHTSSSTKGFVSQGGKRKSLPVCFSTVRMYLIFRSMEILSFLTGEATDCLTTSDLSITLKVKLFIA